MKKIAILGSTGSIGTQTLEVVRENGDIEVISLAAGSNTELLEQQVREFHPQVVCVYEEEKAREFRERLKDVAVRIVTGMDGLIETACVPEAEIVVTAVVCWITRIPTAQAASASCNNCKNQKTWRIRWGGKLMGLSVDFFCR